VNLKKLFNSKLAVKISLLIFSLGIFLLILASISFFYVYKKNIYRIEKKNLQIKANIISKNIEKLLIEKAKIVITMAYSPIIIQALIESNNFYKKLNAQKRLELINSLNKKWMEILNENDPFILKYTNNRVANFLKLQEKIFPDEYGEIFLTNKYGALVASTSKLTTFRHDYKLWWKEAYNNGKGAIFFDDRGYDNSAKTYVLGIVVPVKYNKEILGILKANVAILSGISEIIENHAIIKNYKIQLIRSKGRIIYEKGKIPLVNRVDSKIVKEIKNKLYGTFFLKDYLVSFSQVTLNKTNFNIKFGGTKQTIDHKLGNEHEQWYVLIYQKRSVIQSYFKNYMRYTLIIGILIVLILAIFSFILGIDIVKPVHYIIKRCEKIAKGNFKNGIEINRNDEIGLLATAINEMAEKLNETMVSKRLLEEEIKYRKRCEENLRQISKLESIGSLTAGIAHDFNNILTIISGCIEIAMMSLNSKDALKKNLNRAMEAIERAKNLINQLLAFARKQPAFPRPVELISTIKKLEGMLRELIYEHIKLIFEYKCDRVVVYIDNAQLEQILVNLVVNAKDAVEESENKDKEIIVRVEKVYLGEKNEFNLNKGEYAKISVIDNGIGIPKDILSRIFEPFFTTKKRTHGTGLGLSTVYGIVKQNNGAINVVSEVGKGTVFEIYLPVYNEYFIEENNIENSNLPRGNETILVVEDEDSLREILKNLLKKLGYNVILASNGREAFEIYKEKFKEISLIISDIIMPEMDGKLLFEKIKEVNKNIKIIYISGYPENVLEAKGIDIRGRNFLQKPFTIEKLAYKIREILESDYL